MSTVRAEIPICETTLIIYAPNTFSATNIIPGLKRNISRRSDVTIGHTFRRL